MTDALVSAALTLVSEVAHKITLGAKAVDYLLRFEDLNTWSLSAQSGVCLRHFSNVTVFLFDIKFKFINDKNLIWTPLYRVISYPKET